MTTHENYLLAKSIYHKYGVDVDQAIEQLRHIPISIQCWQGDDVKGFYSEAALSGGISVTGNYPYRARTIAELRNDLEQVFKLVPFKHRVNLHAIYLDTKEKIGLDEIEPKHFETWVNWAIKQGIGLDFNPTLFSHPMSSSGFTLSSQNEHIRQFWVRHVKQSRKIASYFGEALNNPAVCNLWIPDGYKDTPYSRLSPRVQLQKSLDDIYEQSLPSIKDTLESKLFGIGAESYTTGSHEFYMGYAVKHQLGLCLDTGHFHPTEQVGDKLSAIGLFVNHMLLHVSRPVRWDSDHVVSLNDDLQGVAEALVRDDLLKQTSIGLDYFDASINRIAAWVIGIRNSQKALLKALLEPKELLKKIEQEQNYTVRLAYLEELKALPFGLVYDYICEIEHKPVGIEFLKEIESYEANMKGKRP
ncbi:L-rhamnose isomerase [Paracholeplasma manati]|uniref:L-rhamnose isomerase n=1 Tax=Paracholeplasma manati TaxID=591373 RepID=UPI002407F044|nr:L-rhamnose isomerase [Paracholeplasma manati]MDG0888959.1 L-rhamnose isomerase [Paracholeplasma manati]